MIVCVKDKCLKYPVCKFKEFIECQELVKSITEIRHSNLTTPDLHTIIRSVFPSLLQAKGHEFVLETSSWRYMKYDILMEDEMSGNRVTQTKGTSNPLIAFDEGMITGELNNDSVC